MYPDFIFNLTPGDIGYDIETYPNYFSCGFKHVVTGQRWHFEIGFRRSDLYMFCLFMRIANRLGCRFVGFNNLGFDYPVIHTIYQNEGASLSVADIYYKAMSIIKSEHPNARFANMVWESDWVVEQVDLYKIHHFDNNSKSTSLKALEVAMRMDTVEDLPFPVGIDLNHQQADELDSYRDHDIDATIDFYWRSQTQIKAREELSATFGRNMMNMSDVKIGTTILEIELEKHGIKLYDYVDRKKVKRQTIRTHINLADVIFPYVQFEHPEFQRIKNYFQSKVITETKGVFVGLIATVEGLQYYFGTGGIHMSVESQTVISNATHQIVDIDVASYYPNLGIKNKLYPAHLGHEFCDAYEGVFQTRKQYPKGTVMNEMYKLALNGAYGNSNQEHSVFFDSFYTMSITINGQLLLCMLVEQLIKVPGLRMIQSNTDGVTYYCPREYLDHTRALCRWWESITHLTLEEALYSRMFIRDVNNYIAEKEGGKLKRIGTYAYETAEENPGTRELQWHKDWSMRVVAKAAEAALVHGADIRQFILNHQDPYDFFLKAKVPRSSQLFYGGVQVANIVRYYVSTDGDWLEKAMPSKGPEGAYKRANKLTDEYYYSVIQEISGLNPYIDNIPWDVLPWDERINTKNKSRYEASTRQEICSGWTVKLANDVTQYRVNDCWDDIFNSLNYEFYIAEAEKLVKPLLTMS